MSLLNNKNIIIFFICFTTFSYIYSNDIDREEIAKKLNLINKTYLIFNIQDNKTGKTYYISKDNLIHLYKIVGIYSGKISVTKNSFFTKDGNFVVTYKTDGIYKPLEGKLDHHLTQVLQDLDTILLATSP